MIFRRVELIKDNKDVWLDCYIADKVPYFTRKAILVLPGGGYGMCSEREGEPIAQAFMPYGFNAFVLQYSVKEKARFPQPLIEASLAMKYIRDNAEEFGIDAEKVFAIGFSAGGHLCASLGILWHSDEIYKAIDMPFGYNKPNGILPIYPVISPDREIAHRGSFYNILGEGRTEEEYAVLSLDKRVDERSVPAYIVHTAEDKVVNVQNSLRLAVAYAQNKIPFELHVFESGPHGMSLANELTSNHPSLISSHNAKWLGLGIEWINSQK